MEASKDTGGSRRPSTKSPRGDLKTRRQKRLETTESTEPSESTEESTESSPELDTTTAEVRAQWSENREIFAYLLTLMAVLTAVVVVVNNVNTKSVTPVVLERKPAHRRPRRGPPLPYELCVSRACQAEGRYLFDLLTWDYDPCDNFYGFVCQSWKSESVDHQLRDDLDSRVARLLGQGSMVPQPLVPIQNLYADCQDVRSISEGGLVPVRKVLAEAGLVDWPYTMPLGASRRSALWAAAAGVHRLTGVTTLVSVRAGGAHPSRPGRTLLVVEPPRLLVVPSANSAVKSAYLTAARSAIAALRDRLSAPLLAAGVLSFEQRLARALARPSQSNVVRLGAFPQLFEFLTQLLGNSVHEGTELLVASSLAQVIEVATAGPIDAALNYLGFRTLLQLADFVPGSLGRELSALSALVRDSGPLPRWRTCLRAVEAAAPRRFLTAAALALSATAVTPAASRFARAVRGALVVALNDVPWLDDASRAVVYQRLSRAELRLFLPETNGSKPWKNTSFAEQRGLLAFCRIHVASVEDTLRASKPWLGSALDTECSIDANANVVFVPFLLFNFSALTLNELYSFHLPRAGLRLARCLAALFLADADRWSDTGRAGLDRLRRCLAMQRQGGLNPGPVSLHVAKNLALGPVLRLFRANVRRQRQDLRLRNAEDLSADHVFFIYYGIGFCRRHNVTADDVNAPLWNSPAFQKAFGCRAGSFMKPDRSCHLWGRTT